MICHIRRVNDVVLYWLTISIIDAMAECVYKWEDLK